MQRNFSVLDAAAKDIYRELKLLGGNPMMLPEFARPIALLYAIQAVIDNGGFRYLFESVFTEFDPPYQEYSLSYRAIGAFEAADLLDKAVSFFPFEHPHLYAVLRFQFMEGLEEDHPMFTLSDKLYEIYGYEKIWQLMQNYVLKNQQLFAQFRLN